ncbi:hypothetical protein [Bdellovibrio sp. GT3]|uniref:hypothetical protein n=1 Tax=Bdellovibrio sp. GT3 TaxID=3136282 RepID=UPI0030F0488B
MKVVQFCSKEHPIAAYLKDPVDIFCSLLEGNPQKVICFLDTSDLCNNYWNQNPWLEDVCDQVVIVTREVVESFGIEKVPTFNFYCGEYEMHTIIGSPDKSMVLRTIQKVAERL